MLTFLLPFPVPLLASSRWTLCIWFLFARCEDWFCLLYGHWASSSSKQTSMHRKLSVIARFLRVEYSCETYFACLLLLGCKGCLCGRITSSWAFSLLSFVLWRLGSRAFSCSFLGEAIAVAFGMFGILIAISDVLWDARVAPWSMSEVCHYLLLLLGWKGHVFWGIALEHNLLSYLRL